MSVIRAVKGDDMTPALPGEAPRANPLRAKGRVEGAHPDTVVPSGILRYHPERRRDRFRMPFPSDKADALSISLARLGMASKRAGTHSASEPAKEDPGSAGRTFDLGRENES